MDIFDGLPPEFLPAKGTSEHEILRLLSDGLAHPRAELLELLKECPRTPLQRLWGERFEFWNIRNIGTPKGVYILDARHLSGDIKLDTQARSEAKVEYRKRSKQQSEQGAKYLPKACEELEQAKREAEQQHEFEFSDE